MYGSVENMSKVSLQLNYFRFVGAETLHEGCGGAACLVGSGGGAEQTDTRTQSDIVGQPSDQVCICICRHKCKIFGTFETGIACQRSRVS